MRYVLLISNDENAQQALSPEEGAALMADYRHTGGAAIGFTVPVTRTDA